MGISKTGTFSTQDTFTPWGQKSASFPPPQTRDSIALHRGLLAYVPQVINANATTQTTNIFKIMGVPEGSVLILRLWAEVTTTLSSNITNVYYDLYDSLGSMPLTLNVGGPNINAAPQGSVIWKSTINTGSLSTSLSDVGRMTERATDDLELFKPFILTKRNGANTFIRFTYTTTDAPASGNIRHGLIYLPLYEGAEIIPA